MKSRDEQAAPLRLERFFPQDTALTIDDYRRERVPWPEPIPFVSTPSVAVEAVDRSWRAVANCHDLPAGLFFPEANDHHGRREAKAVCAGCSVRAECLDYAVSTGEHHGIWGGVTERERRRIVTRSRAATGGAA